LKAELQSKGSGSKIFFIYNDFLLFQELKNAAKVGRLRLKTQGLVSFFCFKQLWRSAFQLQGPVVLHDQSVKFLSILIFIISFLC